MSKNKIIFCVSSSGGHFYQLLKLTKNIGLKNKIHILNAKVEGLDSGLQCEFIHHAERNISQIINIYEAFFLIRKYRPKVIISTGASPAVIFCLVGKIFKIETIYVESFSRVDSLSLTGRIMRHLTQNFYVQWPKLKQLYPDVRFFGSLL